MDFNTIYEAIKPYIGTGAFASAFITIISLAIKFASVIKDIRNKYKDTENEALKAFKQAIPKELYVNIESLAKQEFEKIVTEIKAIVDEKFLSQIKANTELTEAMAQALCSMKSIPDSHKKSISKLLEIKPETTESLKVELLPVDNEVVVSESISVD